VSGTADQRIVLECRDPLDDFLDARRRVRNFVALKVLQYPVQIVADIEAHASSRLGFGDGLGDYVLRHAMPSQALH